MRLLEDHELRLIGGAGVDTYEFHLPYGGSFTSHLEANQSTTITIQGFGRSVQWNSGQLISCTPLAGGVGFLVRALSGNAALGTLAALAVGKGCGMAFSHTDEDGDEF